MRYGDDERYIEGFRESLFAFVLSVKFGDQSESYDRSDFYVHGSERRYFLFGGVWVWGDWMDKRLQHRDGRRKLALSVSFKGVHRTVYREFSVQKGGYFDCRYRQRNFHFGYLPLFP